MNASVFVQRVDELPVGLDQLVGASTREGFGFLGRLRDEWNSGANRFNEPGEAFFVAYVGQSLAGVCGLNRDPYACNPEAGRVRRLYVAPLFRRQGVARCLVSRALAVACEHYATVRVRTDNPGAAVFYETLGFATATSSPEATHELEMAGGVRRPTTRCS